MQNLPIIEPLILYMGLSRNLFILNFGKKY